MKVTYDEVSGDVAGAVCLEEGQEAMGDSHSTEKWLNASSVISLEIFNMNVQNGKIRLIMLKKRVNWY